MSGPKDVLLAESHDGAGADAERELAAAGIRVHRCHDHGSDGFPCAGLDGTGCAIEGGVDAVVLVRKNAATKPTSLEAGVTCGLRAGLPLVADGQALLDPFDPWVSVRIDDDVDVVAGCHEAVEQWVEDLRTKVADLVEGLLADHGCQPDELHLRLQREGRDARLAIAVPEQVPSAARETIAVRSLDAVRASGRQFDRIDVTVAAYGPGGDTAPSS